MKLNVMIKNVTIAYNKANKELCKFKKYINRLSKYTELMDHTNLKCYDVAYNLENEDDYNMFQWFCECEYKNMEEILNINFRDVVYHIGRSSSFYWIDEDCYNFLEHYNTYDLGCWCSGCEDYKLYDDLSYYIEQITGNDEDIQEAAYIEVMDALNLFTCSIMIDSFKEYYKDNIKTYRYVREFKKNQLVIFKGYF